MRVALPSEVKYARRLVEERDSLLAQAHDEAERVVRNAEMKAGRLVEDHALVRAAQTRALQIEDEAERTADEIRAEAERYAGRLLGRVTERLEQALDNVRVGLRELEAGDVATR
jgi:vacuolar-type H+-ATPase subunit H